MKKRIFSCLFLAASSLFGNTIGFVKYEVPEYAGNWPVLHQEEGTDNILYGSITIEGAEFFGASQNSEVYTLPDAATLQENLQIPFPDQNIEATILEADDRSVLYEWSVKEGGEKLLHGWGRIFCSTTETVQLNYSTGQISRIEELRKIWIPVLQQAQAAPEPQINVD
jgi:hypothetical protein